MKNEKSTVTVAPVCAEINRTARKREANCQTAVVHKMQKKRKPNSNIAHSG